MSAVDEPWGGTCAPGTALLSVDAWGNSYVFGAYGGCSLTVQSGGLTLPSVPNTTQVPFAVQFNTNMLADWAQAYTPTDPTADEEWVSDVALTSDGNLAEVGQLQGTSNKGQSYWTQAVVRKISASTGNVMWYRAYGDKTGSASASAIPTDAQGFLYISGTNSIPSPGSLSFGAGTTPLTLPTACGSTFLVKIAGQ